MHEKLFDKKYFLRLRKKRNAEIVYEFLQNNFVIRLNVMTGGQTLRTVKSNVQNQQLRQPEN